MNTMITTPVQTTDDPFALVGKFVPSYYMGVDLGQVQDYTAIAILEHLWAQWQINAGRQVEMIRLENKLHRYNIVHLERVPLGTSYPDQVTLVKERYEAIPLLYPQSQKTLLADATGVGRPVVDIMRERGLSPIPVVITGGGQPTEGSFGRNIPKRDLVGALQVIMQNGQLKVARELPEAATLVKELQNFKYKISQAGNDTYEAWREGDKDDLVLATAIPVWMAYRYSTGGKGA